MAIDHTGEAKSQSQLGWVSRIAPPVPAILIDVMIESKTLEAMEEERGNAREPVLGHTSLVGSRPVKKSGTAKQHLKNTVCLFRRKQHIFSKFEAYHRITEC